jgi:hypothetical protein
LIAQKTEMEPQGTVGLAGVGSHVGQVVEERKEEHQSGRVSLWLMHDAGYDVDEAPVAWWRRSPCRTGRRICIGCWRRNGLGRELRVADALRVPETGRGAT